MLFRWAGFELDVASRRLVGPDGERHLEPQAFDVLRFLVEQHDRVVAKNEILDRVWGDQFVSESAITTRIKEVRRALDDDGRKQIHLRTVHGRGYQFVGELEAHEPEPQADAAIQRTPAPQRLHLDLAVDRTFAFVGRSTEIGEAKTLLENDRRARIYIGGPPGAGKSRLAIEIVLGGTAMVGAARCDEHGRSALQPIRDVLARLAALRPDQLPSWCEGVEGPLLWLIPSLSEHLDAQPVAMDTYAMIDVLLTVFERVAAEHRLVLLIDDLQWSDEPTRAFLSRLDRSATPGPIASVATFRSDRGSLPPELASWILERRGGLDAHRIDLGDLDPGSAQELVMSVLGDDRDDVASIVDSTGGNCLFLTESIRDLEIGQSGSGSVAELVATRMARQPPETQALVQAGALLGHEFRFATAARASGLEAEQAMVAVDVAIGAGLVHETASPEWFRFSHQLIPHSIATTMSGPALAIAHSRCADALLADDADDTAIAFHLLGAVPVVPLGRAVEASRAAARSAFDRKQFDQAILVLEAVLELDIQTRTRAEILVQIGDAIVARGTTAEAVGAFEEAASIARRNRWPDLLAHAALGHWGRSPFRHPGDTSTLELLAEADRALGSEPSVMRARLLAKTAAFSLFNSSLQSRRATLAEAMAMAPDATGIDRMELLESHAIVFSCPAGIDELDAIDSELEELRGANATYFADAATPETRFLAHGLGHELRDVASFDDIRTGAQPITEWRDSVLGSTLATFAGSFDEARRRCHDGGATGQRYWGESSHPLHALGLLFIDSVSGDWSESCEVLDFLVEVSEAQILLAPLAWSLAATGDEARSRDVLARLRPANLERFSEHIIGGNALVAYAEAALLLDDPALVSRAAELLGPYAHLVLGTPWACSFAAADSLSRLAAHRGDTKSEQEHFQTAQSLYRHLDAPALLNRRA
jgi:DNA-binding winged helix-turn-helix (wHTH) protein/tetratricopeptide (TPR) repeat protein